MPWKKSRNGFAARADIIATFERDPACHRYVDPLLYFKGFQALQTHRMAHRLLHMGRTDFASYLQSRSSMISSVDINPAAIIGKGIMIDHGHDIVIGETSVIEDNVSILQGVTLGGTGKETGDRHPKIRHGVSARRRRQDSRQHRESAIARASPPARSCFTMFRRNRTVAGVPAKIVGYAGCEEPARAMDHKVEEVAGQPE